MTQDEIMEMAREADWPDSLVAPIIMAKLSDFAKLVAAKEREATIKIIKETPFSNWFQADLVEAIRARGEQA